MLYVGATLMIGASIYGFVDYKQTHNKKEFKEMYSEQKKIQPVTLAAKEEVKVTEPGKTAVVTTKEAVTKRKTVAREEPAVSIQPIAEEDKMVTSAKNLTEEPVATVEPAKESSVVKTVKKKKVRKEFFSRGRMPEAEVLIEKPAKKETGKTESKEL